jgi:hypothetical protein
LRTENQGGCQPAPIGDAACRDDWDRAYLIHHLWNERQGTHGSRKASRLTALRNNNVHAAFGGLARLLHGVDHVHEQSWDP